MIVKAIYAISLGLSLFAATPLVFADTRSDIEALVQPYLKKGQVGLSIVDADANREFLSINGNTALLPASVQKLLVTFAVLNRLGSHYTVNTDVFLGSSKVDSAKTHDGIVASASLYMRGAGDPSLTIEKFWILAEELKRLGVGAINDIVIDDTAFVDPPKRSGYNPFEAAQGAFAFNHNCLTVVIAPQALGERALVTVPPGSPVDLVSKVDTTRGTGSEIKIQERVRKTSSGETTELVVEGRIGAQEKPRTEYWTVADPALYGGSVLKSVLLKYGIPVYGQVRKDLVPQSARLVTTIRSKEISEILQDLNRFSSNFAAQQLAFLIGRDGSGKYQLPLGLDRVKESLQKAQIDITGLVLRDASGLHRENRITPRILTSVITHAFRELSLEPDFVASLSRYGLTGTLKHRPLDSSRTDSVWAKTGTIDGVSSLAGILQAGDRRHYAFAIVSNGSISKQDASELEDAIVKKMLSQRD